MRPTFVSTSAIIVSTSGDKLACSTTELSARRAHVQRKATRVKERRRVQSVVDAPELRLKARHVFVSRLSSVDKTRSAHLLPNSPSSFSQCTKAIYQQT
eukprot:4298425-Pleurochrysis_carterae.AAC.1